MFKIENVNLGLEAICRPSVDEGKNLYIGRYACTGEDYASKFSIYSLGGFYDF